MSNQERKSAQRLLLLFRLCLFVCLSVCLSACLPVSLSLSLSLSLSFSYHLVFPFTPTELPTTKRTGGCKWYIHYFPQSNGWNLLGDKLLRATCLTCRVPGLYPAGSREGHIFRLFLHPLRSVTFLRSPLPPCPSPFWRDAAHRNDAKRDSLGSHSLIRDEGWERRRDRKRERERFTASRAN